MIRAIIIAIVAVAFVILGLSFYLQPNDFRSCAELPSVAGDCKAVDAIVAISGGDTTARTDKAISLYQDGWAPLLIFSGAAQDKSGPSNAEAMATHAKDRGVPPEAIQLDEYSETTEENAANSQSIFEQQAIHSVILVTSGYHQRRASLEFNKRTSDVEIKNYSTDDKDWTMWWWLTPRGWWLAVGEAAKIGVFYGKGMLGQ